MAYIVSLCISHLHVLQVKGSSGGYIDVPYCADAVLVNLGALMQNWTSDVYLATVRCTFMTVYAETMRVGSVPICTFECAYTCACV